MSFLLLYTSSSRRAHGTTKLTVKLWRVMRVGGRRKSTGCILFFSVPCPFFLLWLENPLTLPPLPPSVGHTQRDRNADPRPWTDPRCAHASKIKSEITSKLNLGAVGNITWSIECEDISANYLKGRIWLQNNCMWMIPWKLWSYISNQNYCHFFQSCSIRHAVHCSSLRNRPLLFCVYLSIYSSSPIH